jgi:hypothetical protein
MVEEELKHLREGMWKPEGMEGAGGEANESKNGTAWD